MAAIFDIRLDSGATYRTTFTVSLTDDDGDAYLWESDDMAAITMTIREGNSRTEIDVPLAVSETGLVTVHMPPEMTARLQRNRSYYYVIDVTLPSGDVQRVLRGSIFVNAGGRNG